MRRLIPILVALSVAVLCVKPGLPTDAALASFLGTRADAPLEGTVWQYDAPGDYDRFLVFRDGTVSLFYGLVEDDAIQRWSDFYGAAYSLKDGEIVTKLEFPLWGEKEKTQKASVVKSAGSYTIDLDGDLYEICRADASDLDALWMTITVNILPWDL